MEKTNTIFLDFHNKKYPNMENQDKIKLIYQGTLGPKHLGFKLSKDEIKDRLLKEIMDIPVTHRYDDIYEWVSENYLRLNIFPFIEINDDYSYNLEYLTNAFYYSSLIEDETEENLKANLAKYLPKDDYKDYNFKPIHHSTYYEETYEPRYRLVYKDYLNLELRKIQLANFIKRQNPYSIIALEGKTASGKSTLAKNFRDIYTIIDMNDFYLPLAQITEERKKEIGGVINYELVNETLDMVIDAWRNRLTKINIKVFDVHTQTYFTKELILKNNKVLLEGAYSSHPYFRNKVKSIAYLFVNENDQLVRIKNRNLSTEEYNNFINSYLPLEDEYLNKIKIYSICDVIV